VEAFVHWEDKLVLARKQIYTWQKNANDEELVLKFHRLGRTSFRAVKKKRDYLRHRKSASWLYLSRLAAIKEFAFMKVLYEHNFPVPKPIDLNRHVVLMELVDGVPLYYVKELKNPEKVYTNLMNLIVKLANYGLIHSDYNEFNILINEKEDITLIDFPQMVSIDHENAEMYFNRDVECIRTFFKKRFGYESERVPVLGRDTQRECALDKEVAASGFDKTLETLFNELQQDQENDNEIDSQSDNENDIQTTGQNDNNGTDGDRDSDNFIPHFYNDNNNGNGNGNDKDDDNNVKLVPDEVLTGTRCKNECFANESAVESLFDKELLEMESLSLNDNESNATEGKNSNSQSLRKERGEHQRENDIQSSNNEIDEENMTVEEMERLKQQQQSKQLQKRVKKQLEKKERQKLRIRNNYKNREKRRLREEANINNWN
jgi:RIO kinase 2